MTDEHRQRSETSLQREFDAFHAVLEREPAEREAFVRKAHAGDPELVRRLLRLLAAHERAERVDSESPARAAAPVPSETDAAPERIGPYRVLEPIGEGGMGVVYAAEQTAPFRRRVAIKVIKLGMDSKEVVARFEAERQALAMMDHPGVAKALDAGVSERGRPYFVMELVKGLPLIEYCSKHRLGLRDRLRLFIDVCAAIQHAHQKGIIHRDLKPSNILVAVQEGRAVPKVIDFGVAKATAARLTERTVFTEQGRLIGTPEYMSPEQAEMSGLDVDTRTDVYSLGVVLYELLTGVLPLDAKALRAGGYAEVLRVVREVDPRRPSTRVYELARGRQGATQELLARARALRGELDWIAMRAMEKDRTRRYGTASALGEDVERYLADLPVLAGPPGFAYSVRKFVKRHRYVASLAALAAVSAVLGLAGLTIGLMRARDAEALATRRADSAQAAAAFLQRVLFQADPEFVGGSPTLLQVMDGAGRMVEEELGDYPEVEASVRESIGVAYRRLSRFVEAEPHLRRSLELRRGLFGDEDPETARSYIALADLLFEYEGKVDAALELLRRALRIYEANDMIGTVAEAWLQLDVGIVALAGDRLGEAERAFERCRELLARFRGPDHPDVSRPVRGLAQVALGRGDLEAAERLAREAVALCEDEGEDYIGARAETVLAQVWIAADRLDDASGILDRTELLFAGTVGGRHIRIAERRAVLGELHLRAREYGTAEHISALCEEIRRELLHADHWAILEAGLLRQRARIGLGERSAAELELRAIAEAVERSLGSDHALGVEVARARLDCAVAAGDAGAIEARSARLDELLERRARRLRAAEDP